MTVAGLCVAGLFEEMQLALPGIVPALDSGQEQDRPPRAGAGRNQTRPERPDLPAREPEPANPTQLQPAPPVDLASRPNNPGPEPTTRTQPATPREPNVAAVDGNQPREEDPEEAERREIERIELFSDAPLTDDEQQRVQQLQQIVGGRRDDAEPSGPADANSH
ncbi:MAG: hypothetical protein ACOC93_05065 [Planctomycetota bacterium]